MNKKKLTQNCYRELKQLVKKTINDLSINENKKIMDRCEHIELNGFINIPLSWRDSARSWKMTIEQYIKEADKIIDSSLDGSGMNEKSYEDLVPIFNPIANIDTITKEILIRSFSTIEEYEQAIIELEKKHPKFTFAM
jgi:hypothetical protein